MPNLTKKINFNGIEFYNDLVEGGIDKHNAMNITNAFTKAFTQAEECHKRGYGMPDTLAYFKKLVEAGMNEEQAKIMVDMMVEIDQMVHKDILKKGYFKDDNNAI